MNRTIYTPKRLLWLSILLITACRALAFSDAPTRIPNAASPSPTGSFPTPQGETPNQRPASSASVLEACSLEDQAAAMLPDQVPAWESLGLAACYELELDLPLEKAKPTPEIQYNGRARVTFSNLNDQNLDELVFRLYPNAEIIYGGQLEVVQVRVDGRPAPAEIFLEDGTGLRIPLADPLAPGKTTVIEMDFRGTVVDSFKRFDQVYGVFRYDPATQFLTLANWFPLLAPYREGSWQAEPVIGIGDAVVSDTALYKVRIRAPENLSLAATGSQIEERREGEQIIRHFVSGPVREFNLVLSPNFTETRQEVDGILIRHWGLPGGEASWREARQATADAVALFNQLFGPYPYAELDVVAAPMRNASGVEYPGLFLIREGLYAPDEDRPYILGLVAAHEAAHQWWYGLVGSDVLQDPWQDEGLVTFSSTLYQEAYQPRYYEGTLAYYEEQVEGLAREGSDVSLDQPLAAFEGRENLYGSVVYLQGAIFFETLHQQLGDEIFFAALQAYFEGHRYSFARPEDLLNTFEKSCQCRLDEFYQEWGLDSRP